MSRSNKGFVFYREYRERVKKLKPVDRLVVYEALIDYKLDKSCVDVHGLSGLLEELKKYNSPEIGKGRKKRGKRKGKQKDYNEYLKSEHWVGFRDRVRAKYSQCVVCGSTDKLQVHHKWYGTLGKEKFDDVAMLCENCHKKYHKDYDRVSKNCFKKFYKDNFKPTIRIIKRNGSVIDMAKAVEQIKLRGK